MPSNAQLKLLETALQNWPEKTGERWINCPVGFLGAHAGIPLPISTGGIFAELVDVKRFSDAVKNAYGLPAGMVEQLIFSSSNFFRTAKSRSRKQKEMLENFLQKSAPLGLRPSYYELEGFGKPRPGEAVIGYLKK